MNKAFFAHTNLPKKVIESIEEDLLTFEDSLSDECFVGSSPESKTIDERVRKSKITWIPSSHWICGFIWHYIQVANQKNFLFDIDGLDNQSVQYTVYEKGDHYTWHTDDSFGNLYVPTSGHHRALKPHTDDRFNDFINVNLDLSRKISFSLQLSDPEDYEGGELQIMDYDDNSIICPKERGTLIVFDSRSKHRVKKVRSGTRKSIVGWAIGKRWR